MSFGWSAGDIVAAIYVLHKDTIAFLETLAVTLQHFNVLQTISPNDRIAQNVQEHCNQIGAPLQVFLSDTKQKYERAALVTSTRGRLLATPRKIKWALSTSKKAKELQARMLGPMVAISLLQAQQTSLLLSQLPTVSQDQIARTLETAVRTGTEPLKSLLEGRLSRSDPNISDQQIIGRNAVNPTVEGDYRSTSAFSRTQGLELCTQVSSLESKMEILNTTIQVLTNHIGVSRNPYTNSGASTEEHAQVSLEAIWQLLVYLQRMLHELILLALPYVLCLLRDVISALLSPGDRFLLNGKLKRTFSPDLNERIVSLAVVLSTGLWKSKPRMKLGLKLASTVLQHYKTSRMGDIWGKEDVLFIQQGDGTVIVDRPFFKLRPPVPLSDRGKAVTSFINMPLFSLGVVLIELYFKKSIEELQELEGGIDANPTYEPEIYHLRKTLLILRLIEKMDAGDNFEGVVKQCIKGPDGAMTDLDKQELCDMVEEKIIFPLERQVLWVYDRQNIEDCV